MKQDPEADKVQLFGAANGGVWRSATLGRDHWPVEVTDEERQALERGATVTAYATQEGRFVTVAAMKNSPGEYRLTPSAAAAIDEPDDELQRLNERMGD